MNIEHPVNPQWARRNLEETRWRSREWKEGYKAASAHRKWTVAALLVAAVIVLRRTRAPIAAIFAWIVMLGICLAPVLVVLLAVEQIHRRRQQVAMRERQQPFPEWDERGGEAA